MSKTKSSTQAIVAKAQTMIAGLPGESNPFGISKAQRDAVVPTDLIAAESELEPLRALLHSKVQAKDALKDGVAAGLSRAAATAYASDATDAELATIGLPPRRAGSSRPKLPATPTDVTLALQSNGDLLLKWANVNPKGTLYTVESSPDGLVYAMTKTVTRHSYVIEGAAPGVPLYVRVSAATAAGPSTPSAPVVAYAPASAAPVAATIPKATKKGEDGRPDLRLAA